MDEIFTTLRQKLDLLVQQFATRSSYVDQRVSFLRYTLSLSWLTTILVAPMLLLWWLALAPEHAEATGSAYIATQADILPTGSTRVVRAANDRGEIVGTISRDHRGQRGFFLDSGRLQEIAGLPIGSDSSTAFGINNRGQVVGSMNTATGMRAFRSQRATGTVIVVLKSLPGDTGSAALAINHPGKATGWSSGTTGVRAVIWSPAGAIQALPMLPASGSCRGQAINDRGDVVGVCGTASGPRAVLWAGGIVQDLGTLPGSYESAALGINNSGDIVGSSGDPEGQHYAVLWLAGGVIQNLGILPNRISSKALALNDRGEVVGVSEGSGGEHAFLWTEQAGMQDLNNLLTPGSGFVLTHAIAISAQGLIVAIGHDEIKHPVAHDAHGAHELPLRIFRLRPAGGP